MAAPMCGRLVKGQLSTVQLLIAKNFVQNNQTLLSLAYHNSHADSARKFLQLATGKALTVQDGLRQGDYLLEAVRILVSGGLAKAKLERRCSIGRP
jgi:hypothetical protein